MTALATLAVVGWPVLDRIPLGPLAVSPHGIGIAVGYLMGSWWMLREGKKRGLSEDHVGSILLWALVGAIVGARFFYVLGHWSDFSDDPLSALRIWEGGISLVGGIAGAVIFAYPVMRKFNYRFLQVMDSAAIGLAFGIMIGRIGDLVIGDHLGKPTDFFLGWAYRGGELPGPWGGTPATGWAARLPGGFIETLTRDGAELCRAAPDGVSCGEVIATGAGVHQTALYDLFIAGGLFLFLRWLNRRPRREGVMIMAFAIWYGTGRVITDFLRIDKTYFGLTGSQLTSIAVVLISLYTLWRFARRPAVGADGGDADDGDVEETEGPKRMEPASTESTTRFIPPREPGPGGEERSP